MNLILTDDKEWEYLLPLTFTKPTAELRMGIFTFRERWEKLLNCSASFYTKSYLSKEFPIKLDENNLYVNASYFPTEELIEKIKNIQKNQVIVYQNNWVAFCGKSVDFSEGFDISSYENVTISNELIHINRSWKLFQWNDYAIKFDYNLVTKNRKSAPIPKTNGVIGEENIFLEEGAIVNYAILNANEGPIYIGKNAEIMEGSMVRGSLALCDNAKINMGAKIYGGTTIGPFCKVGGEINNAILMAYSNKGHDGFLGNSVIGEWCNLGADTNSSNLKNNYAEVKLWSFPDQKFINTNLQFCGLIMGDFSKSAINTQFNTGTVIGVNTNIFDAGFPPNYVPSFTWGGKKNQEKYQLEKAYEANEKMMQRRNKTLNNNKKEILKHIFKLTK